MTSATVPRISHRKCCGRNSAPLIAARSASASAPCLSSASRPASRSTSSSGISASSSVDPLLVLARHGGERGAAARGQSDVAGAPVGGGLAAARPGLALEPVDDRGDVAAGHHQPARQLAHAEPVGRPLERRHQVEARQRGGEAGAQKAPHLALDHAGRGVQAQPQAQPPLGVAAPAVPAFGRAPSRPRRRRSRSPGR